MEVIIRGSAKEIAALVFAVQERRGGGGFWGFFLGGEQAPPGPPAAGPAGRGRLFGFG